MSPGLRLPIEVVEHTVDFLYDDIHTLTACAVTSRALLPAARFHIWREITVSAESDPPHVRIQALLEILDTNSDIAPLVQSLTLHGSLATQSRNRVREYWDDPDGTMLLWERLPNLHVLKFVQLNFSNGLHQLIPFAYSLPNLEELALADFDAVPQRGHSTSPPYRESIVQLHTSCKLRRLTLSGHWGGWALWLFLENLAKLLLEPGMHAPLETLDLSCVVRSSNLGFANHIRSNICPSLAWAPTIASLGQTLRHCTLGLLEVECSRTLSISCSIHGTNVGHARLLD